jgi:hypothetical protein
MQGLNDSYSGGLSSYGLVLLVTSLLQLENQREKQQQPLARAFDSSVVAPAPIPDSIFTTKAALAVRASEFGDSKTVNDSQSNPKRTGEPDLGRLFVALLDTFGVRFLPQVNYYIIIQLSSYVIKVSAVAVSLKGGTGQIPRAQVLCVCFLIARLLVCLSMNVRLNESMNILIIKLLRPKL